MARHRPFSARKLLIAAVGVASVNYLTTACGGATEGSKFDDDGGVPGDYPPTSGNLAAPIDAGLDTAPPTSGNLAAPIDANVPDTSDADGSLDDAGDAG